VTFVVVRSKRIHAVFHFRFEGEKQALLYYQYCIVQFLLGICTTTGYYRENFI